MGKKKGWSFDVPIYGGSFRLFVGSDSADKYYGTSTGGGEGFSAYVTTMEDSDGYQEVVMVFSTIGDFAHDTLAHECLHAAWRILEIHGVHVDRSNHEALAYLLGWMYAKVEPVLQPIYEKEQKKREKL